MSQSKVISVRMDKSLIESLDKVAASYPYRTRNEIICKILRNVLRLTDDRTLKDLIYLTWGATDSRKLLIKKKESV